MILGRARPGQRVLPHLEKMTRRAEKPQNLDEGDSGVLTHAGACTMCIVINFCVMVRDLESLKLVKV